MAESMHTLFSTRGQEASISSILKNFDGTSSEPLIQALQIIAQKPSSHPLGDSQLSNQGDPELFNEFIKNYTGSVEELDNAIQNAGLNENEAIINLFSLIKNQPEQCTTSGPQV